jgi:hypothetical protein
MVLDQLYVVNLSQVAFVAVPLSILLCRGTKTVNVKSHVSNTSVNAPIEKIDLISVKRDPYTINWPSINGSTTQVMRLVYFLCHDTN